MSELPLSQKESDTRTILFMVALSFVCALILSLLASALAQPKEIARDLDRTKQMMIAAKILNHEGQFILQNEAGESIPAKSLPDGSLIPAEHLQTATREQLLEVNKKRFVPILVDDKGEKTTFAKASIDEDKYLADYKKTGYYKEPLKLVYEILPNPPAEGKPIGYIIPVNGYGLWDAIYGYLALKPDGDTVIGISWYEQKETPGLGANIAEAEWQSLFPGKLIFQPSADGTTDFRSAPLGITVVKGKVSNVLGDSLKAKSAVDGMAGATLTGNGVTEAYRDVLAPYRPFLVRIHEENNQEKR